MPLSLDELKEQLAKGKAYELRATGKVQEWTLILEELKKLNKGTEALIEYAEG
jgi:hypothetical protein